MASTQLDRAAVVVAHPDDETLWAGGMILMHPACEWAVATLCRASDTDRAPRHRLALNALGATGRMADLDDGPDQDSLDEALVESTVADLLGTLRYDVIITHGPSGEYTRHRRHEEVSRAVCALWTNGVVVADKLWMFAYEDGNRSYLPRAVRDAHLHLSLSPDTWHRKQEVVEEIYGFGPDTFEARTCPRSEAFWTFRSSGDLSRWLNEQGGEL